MNAARKVFIVLVALFLVLLPLQFLIAGYGVFGGGYDEHEVFGGMVLHGLTALMTIAALLARRWKLAGLAFVMVVVMGLQIGLVEIGRDADQPWISALHPFLAFCYWPYTYFLLWKPVRSEAPVVSPAIA